MTTPVTVYTSGNGRCARGWMVSNDGGGRWWHSGSLPGSTSMIMRGAGGACSAVICNTRTEPHQEMDTALYQVSLDMIGRFSS